MRIGAGQFKGLKLSILGGKNSIEGLRPTASKVRSSIFDMLLHGIGEESVVGARVLDLFAGTGAMGLEAISRGAAHAMFVDSDRLAVQLIQKNIRLARTERATTVLNANAAHLPANQQTPFDLAFVDAPYGSGLESIALESAAEGSWIAPRGIVSVESAAEFEIPPPFKILKRRSYRRTNITLLEMCD